MKAFAPGKIVLTGAYAVLEGAPSIVLATTRGVFADASRTCARATPEVVAALGEGPAPWFSAAELFDGERKLGLGASAAILVASLASREAARGVDLASDAERAKLFDVARRAHADAQGGGSGVDVAASVYGGVLEYRRPPADGAPAAPARARLPRSVVVTVLGCGESARTSELRARVDALAPARRAARFEELTEIAEEAALAARLDAGGRFVAAVRGAARSLSRLGEEAGAPIVPREIAALDEIAAAEGAAVCVAGAGGGDVAAWVGAAAPSGAAVASARSLGVVLLDVGVDEKGVRTVAEVKPSAMSQAS